MKIKIWIPIKDAVKGKVDYNNYSVSDPDSCKWVEVLISPNEFQLLEDSDTNKEENDWGSDHWLTKQYNRNRDHKDHVKSKKDIPYIYERNPDTGDVFRRRSGDYTSPRELIKDSKKDTATLGLGERFYASDKELEELKKEMKKKTGADFMEWFHKLTKNEQTKLAGYYND
jgi:hypothetical protein